MKLRNSIEFSSFNFFIDINIYLDSFNALFKFSDVFHYNLDIISYLSIECNWGSENILKSEQVLLNNQTLILFWKEILKKQIL